jgi:hypothetical protein
MQGSIREAALFEKSAQKLLRLYAGGRGNIPGKK